MRSSFFAGVLKVVGIPLFLVKWILKAIWFITYGLVGILYKTTIISGVTAGKIVYTIISTTILIALILLIKK